MGDIVVCSVKSVAPGSEMKKGAVVRAVIVRCKQPTRRADGSYVRFDSNAAVIIDDGQKPARHAHFRRRRPRTARSEFHENRQPRQRGRVMWIKSNDTVKVIAGEDRGTTGKVLRVNRKAGKLVVEGVNRVYKHVKRSQKNPQGGRLSKEMPIFACNVQLVCEGCGAATRLGVRYLPRRRQGALLQEVRGGQRPGVAAQGPVRHEIMLDEPRTAGSRRVPECKPT